MTTTIETVFVLVDICDDPKRVLGAFTSRGDALHALFDHELPLQYKGGVQVWVVDDLLSVIEDSCEHYTFNDCLDLQDFVDEDFKQKVTSYHNEMMRLSKARKEHKSNLIKKFGGVVQMSRTENVMLMDVKRHMNGPPELAIERGALAVPFEREKKQFVMVSNINKYNDLQLRSRQMLESTV